MSFRRFTRILRRWLLLAVIASAVFVGGLYAYRFHYALQYDYDDSLDGADLGVRSISPSGITNIALFGIDARPGEEVSRSDSIMILTIDNTRGKLKLTSVMRDSLVSIGGDENKINHAYTLGAKQAVRTLNENFDLDITEYATVNFNQMCDIIDIIGGINITVFDYEVDETNRFIREYCVEQRGIPNYEDYYIREEGYQWLNGVQAMSYGRIRKNGTGDDWQRVNRQAAVLKCMIQKVDSLSIGKLADLAVEILPNMKTSLKISELTPLMGGMLRNGKPSVEHFRIPVDGCWEYSSDGAYILFDTEEASQQLHDYIYDDKLPDDVHKDGHRKETGDEEDDF